MVKTGLERIIERPDLLGRAGRLGLLYNQASVDASLRPAPEQIARAFPGKLVKLFGPQHGVGGAEQDNMNETEHSTHPVLGLPIHSLYSETRRPLPHMLDEVDTVLVDIQDVGARVYTFATTVLYLMEACATHRKRLVVLDRPNPINGKDIEGNLLEPEFASFVGPHPIPMRHGLTLGELMTLYNEVYGIGPRVEVIAMEGWRRDAYFDQTGLPWVLPSPNMPLLDTANVYPGQVILEGCNLSEGRGTTRPFELFGAPYLHQGAIIDNIEDQALVGAVLRETAFRPTFNKWVNEVCHGFQIHVTARDIYRPYRATLALLAAIIKLHPHDFSWSSPPYEYVYDKLPVDVITGSSKVRLDLEQGRSALDMEREWADDLEAFDRLRSRFFLYTP
ncbi:MAG: DUF1343 domain-containing protein [Deltaproteobacteria bacterium]|nr:DUF1343 domain-containing protein [Deltaproteobacteria bacterium]